jgi:hypothetical protein
VFNTEEDKLSIFIFLLRKPNKNGAKNPFQNGDEQSVCIGALHDKGQGKAQKVPVINNQFTSPPLYEERMINFLDHRMRRVITSCANG